MTSEKQTRPLTQDELAGRVESLLLSTRSGKKHRKDEILYRCLRHDDTHPSAEYNTTERVWNCFPCRTGGGVIDLAKDLGIPLHAPVDGNGRGKHHVQELSWADVRFGEPERFVYETADGKPVFQVVRRDAIDPPANMPKSERKRIHQERSNGAGGWKGGRGVMEGVDRPLYSLPLLAHATGRVYVVEGERKADRLIQDGLIATTSAMGAGKWEDRYAGSLHGAREVVVLPDCDKPGQEHARDVARSLINIGVAVKILNLDGLDEHEDVLNWLDRGHTITELEQLADTAPQWAPGVDDIHDAARQPENPLTPDMIQSGYELAQARTQAGHENGSATAAALLEPVLVRLADVQPVPLAWLWQGRIPIGKLTVLDGDPGTGKSLLSLDIAARLTRTNPMPDGSTSEAGGGGVVLMAAEDDPGDTVRPRFDVSDGDPARLVVLQGLRDPKTGAVRPPCVRDIEAIRVAANMVQARLVVVDPLMAYLGGADSHKDAEIRSALHHLVELAQSERLAVLLIRHLNKSPGSNPIYRGGGSIGILAAARSGLLVAEDPDEPESGRRILTATKCNLALMPRAITYRIVATEGVARIEWGGETDHNAADLLETRDQDERVNLSEARSWLEQELSRGAVPSARVMANARQNGISERTLRRAKKLLAVRAVKNGQGPWHWTLESDPFAGADDGL